MTSFEILLTEPSYLDFTVDYNQSITKAIFDNMFNNTVADKTSSNLFVDGLCLFINTNIPLRRELRLAVQMNDNNISPYKLELSDGDISDLKQALYAIPDVSDKWVPDKYINFVFTTTPVTTPVWFCIKVKMQ